MSKIRHSRINKYRKQNWKAIILGKVFGIWILFSFTLMYLTGNTAAYFNDHSTVSGIFTAGFWEEVIEKWDKSSLKFIEPKKEVTITSCEPTIITATIKNTGNDMQGTSEYFIYHTPKGNPKHGEKIFEGLVNPIYKNNTTILEFEASIAGNFKFKSLQRPGHGNKYDSRHELWSETIKVECKKDNSIKSITDEKEKKSNVNKDTLPNENTKEDINEENTEGDSSVNSEFESNGDTPEEESEPNQKDQIDTDVSTNNVETIEETETQDPNENESSNEED
ncbi:amyloid fiber anchoring/assembly protein TapA [Sutcliffiella horikoshii]|uniref:amyloid fiber anchoring/assembly protein TapA n=1 Tax=Sutcliffiella horikoshii TaxID=79883 RepID=UPI000AD3D3C7|nr:amyloid fiber anchoring/assembly protein TapA [Sutcliffiella horikoshii]